MPRPRGTCISGSESARRPGRRGPQVSGRGGGGGCGGRRRANGCSSGGDSLSRAEQGRSAGSFRLGGASELASEIEIWGSRPWQWQRRKFVWFLCLIVTACYREL